MAIEEVQNTFYNCTFDDLSECDVLAVHPRVGVEAHNELTPVRVRADVTEGDHAPSVVPDVEGFVREDGGVLLYIPRLQEAGAGDAVDLSVDVAWSAVWKNKLYLLYTARLGLKSPTIPAVCMRFQRFD